MAPGSLLGVIHDQENRITSAPQISRQPRLLDLPLSQVAIDRAAVRRGPDLLATLIADPATQVLEVSRGRLHIGSDPSQLVLRSPEPADADRLAVFLGQDAGTAYLAVHIGPPGVEPPGLTPQEPPDPLWQGLRALAPELTAAAAALAVQAVGVLNWHGTHPRCSRCGEPTEVVQSGYARRCPHDGSEHYPRTDPAVIMVVEDGDGRVLLGRHVGWPSGRFSTLAGFVEPGESLEAAVRREVLEEVGVEVGEVTYLGSQPWPFPSSLMIGFRALALSQTPHPDGEEIAEARWFDRESLPASIADGVVGLSPRLSIARALIEHWYGGRLEDPPPVGPQAG